MISLHFDSLPRNSLVCASVLLLLTSCDQSTASNSADSDKICDVNLTRTDDAGSFQESTTVSYSGTLSSECQEKTTALSGRAQINLAAQSNISSASISLQELKAGQRNLQFDSDSDNFARGTYEKRFDSSFYPEWSFPWSDRPTRVTLSMNISDQTPVSALPSSVRLELIY